MEYEICSDPFDRRYVGATFLYPPGDEPEDAKLLLEEIRGKEEDMIHKYTPEDEFNIINDQVKNSQGFDIDFSMFRCLYSIRPVFLDQTDVAKAPETDREFFGRLAKEAIAGYNQKKGTSFEFVEVEKVNLFLNSGYIFFMTFLVKDHINQTQIFQAKVTYIFCREIEHNFCRPKPARQVESNEGSMKVVKKRRI